LQQISKRLLDFSQDFVAFLVAKMPKYHNNNLGIFCYLAIATDYLNIKYSLLNILCSSWEIPECGEFPWYFCRYNGYKCGYTLV